MARSGGMRASRIAILGGGAMGGLWAATLASRKHEVLVVDVAGDLVATIRSTGLLVDTPSGEIRAHPHATTDPVGEQSADVVFIFVKAQHSRSASELAEPLVGPATTVVSLQNGLGNADVIAERFPGEQIVMGVTYNSATLVSAGHVRHTGLGHTFVGPYVDGFELRRAHAIGDLLVDAGLATTVTGQVKAEIWKKLILNSSTLATAALTGLRAAELMTVGHMRAVVDQLVTESTGIANALGYPIDVAERIEQTHAVLERAGLGKPSMLQDVEARRKTEIEVINGAVATAALSVGLRAPLNELMVALVGGLEQSWRR